MRHIVKRAALLAPALMLMAAPLLAAEFGGMDKSITPGVQGVKDECLLVASNCKVEPSPLELRIERIKKEIDKGTSVYTNEELNTLKRNLDEERESLENLYRGG